MAFFRDYNLPVKKLHGFFSMVQTVKALHSATIAEMTDIHGKRLMKAQISFASDIERMGLLRAPVMASTPSSVASSAYSTLYSEVQKRVTKT